MRQERILIVEDLDQKANALKVYVNSIYPNIKIEHRESYNSSLKEIFKNDGKYDIILLDMTMNTFDISEDDNGGVPEPLAGRQILDGMYLRDIKTPVVVVTMYNSFDGVRIHEFDEYLKREYADIYRGYVFFEFNSNDWKMPLRNYLEEIYG